MGISLKSRHRRQPDELESVGFFGPILVEWVARCWRESTAATLDGDLEADWRIFFPRRPVDLVGMEAGDDDVIKIPFDRDLVVTRPSLQKFSLLLAVC